MLINIIKKLQRDKINLFSRKSYLRMDKNERVSNFNNSVLKKLKFSSFDLAAYPETGFIYKILAKKLGVSKDQLILTPGSDFGIKTCFEYFCNNNKKKSFIGFEPTFGMVDVYSKLYNIKKINIKYNKKLDIDTNYILKKINKKISMILLANPNSPTGTIIDEKNILKIIGKAKKFQIPVVIDEAYNGFYKKSYLSFIKKFKNLIILRTFSKSYGLAGLRAGYLISNKSLIKEMCKFRPMYEINSIACKVISILLKNPSIEKKYVLETFKGKSYFQKELKKLEIEFLRTYANFIHINLKSKKKLIEKKLSKNKILTRKGPGVSGFESYLRITLGPKREMEKVIKILRKHI